MAIGAVFHFLQIEGRNLTGHINGNPALQPQHHFLEGAVKVVNDVETQPLFERHGDGEHPLFSEFHIRRHVLHRHVGAHKDLLGRLGQNGALEKVQLARLHALQSVITAGSGTVEGDVRHLEVVEMNDLDIIVKTKAVEVLEKIADRLFFVGQGGAVQKICRKPCRQRLLRKRHLCGLTEEGIDGGDAVGVRIARNNIVTHAPTELRRVGGARFAVADAGEVRGVEGDGLCHLVDIDAEGDDQRVETRAEAVKIELLLFFDRRSERSSDVLLAADGMRRLFGKCKKRCRELLELFAVGLRRTLSAPIAADDRLGHGGAHRKLLGGAVQRFQVGIEHFMKFHGEHLSVCATCRKKHCFF